MKRLILILCASLLFCSTWCQCVVGAPTYKTITVDGDISDWNTVITNPDNVTNDGSPDLDAPISDLGRDFVRMVYTADATNLYLLFERAGSANNQVTVMLFMDVDNNNVMQADEPVIVLAWNGMNAKGNVDIYDYIPSNPAGDPLTPDGVDMPGLVSASARQNIASNIIMGSANGLSAEIAVPFTAIKQKGSSNPFMNLAFGEAFNWHVSSLNGSVATFGQPNSTNDNWRRCGLSAPLPVRMISFEGRITENRITLKWSVELNEDGLYYIVLRSQDGNRFEYAGTVPSTSNTGKVDYQFEDGLLGSKIYYQLQMVDWNGKVTYSKVISLLGRDGGTTLSLLNNPFSDRIDCVYKAGKNGTCLIQVFDAQGVLRYSSQVRCSAGPNRFSVRPGDGKPGIYLVRITSETGAVVQAKAIGR